MKRWFGILLAVIVHTYLPHNIHANEPSDTSKTASTENAINPYKITTVAAVTSGAFIVGHGLLNDLWWKGTKVPFHINSEQDYRYALNSDKFGHATFAFLASKTYHKLFQWCGMSEEASAWGGFGVATAYQTYIEVRDGYSRDYGFSWGDITANTIGAGLPILQHYVPEARAFNLQLSFYPSAAFRNGEYNAIIDDYTSTTHWLSFSLYNFLPKQMQVWYPQWLNLAVGHSVENLDGKGAGNHVLYISIDWNLSKINGLPTWLKDIFEILHVYHLPAPAVRIAPNVAWFGLKF